MSFGYSPLLVNEEDEEAEGRTSTIIPTLPNLLPKWLRYKLGCDGSPVPKDFIFMILFYINIVVISLIAIGCSLSSILHQASLNFETYINYSKDNNINSVKKGSYIEHDIVVGVLLVTMICVLCSTVTVYFFINLSKFSLDIVSVSFVLTLAVSLIGAIYLFIKSLVVFGVICTIIGGFTIYTFLSLQKRLHFASIIIKISCEALVKMPMLLYTSIVSQFMLMMYIIAWFVVVISSIALGADKTDSPAVCKTYSYYQNLVLENSNLLLQCSGGSECHACVCNNDHVLYYSSCHNNSVSTSVYVIMTILLLWTATTLSNVNHCCTANAVCSWWVDKLAPCSADIKDIFYNILSSNMGSIALGSLLVTTIKMTRYIVYHVSNAFNKISGNMGAANTLIRVTSSCINATLASLDQLSEYFSKYAFVYIAIYDYSFMDGSVAVTSLFRLNGFQAIMNDTVVDVIIVLSQLTMAIVLTIIAYMYGSAMDFDNKLNSFLVLGFISGFIMSSLTLSSLITAATNAVYVCWCDNRQSLERNHVELYKELLDAWNVLNSEDPSSHDVKTSGYAPPIVISGSYKAGVATTIQGDDDGLEETF